MGNNREVLICKYSAKSVIKEKKFLPFTLDDGANTRNLLLIHV